MNEIQRHEMRFWVCNRRLKYKELNDLQLFRIWSKNQFFDSLRIEQKEVLARDVFMKSLKSCFGSRFDIPKKRFSSHV